MTKLMGFLDLRHAGCLVAALICIQSGVVCSADDSTGITAKARPADSYAGVRAESIVAKAGHKFVRGLTNVLTGTGEIPRQMIISYDNDGPALFVPVGFFTGVFMTVVRTSCGAVEIVSFPVPVDGTYDPLIEPAFVWGTTDTEKKNRGQENK